MAAGAVRPDSGLAAGIAPMSLGGRLARQAAGFAAAISL
jgi:hypothetical protein